VPAARRRPPSGPELLKAGTVSEALGDPAQRELLGMPTGTEEPMDIVVELNLLHRNGLEAARDRFEALHTDLRPTDPERLLVATTYYRCKLSITELKELVLRDQRDTDVEERAIYRVWPDFPVSPMIDRSVATVKADAARRSYEASGVDVAWAVIDSGIHGGHDHFRHYETLTGEVAGLHRDFTRDGDPVDSALTDELGHGTHVAGVIAGGYMPAENGGPPLVGQHVINELQQESVEERAIREPMRLAGVAPHCKLVSLKVLNAQGTSRSTDVLRALQYVREEVNGHGKLLRIHGVNLSVGYEFDARWFACGQSPICVEVDRLVQSGVVVVVAAGNTGYGEQDATARLTNTGLTLTINDPGNADRAITVGATHRDSPHTFGVSYFSSKGPTGDGRLKPDLVAPGERITSCAAGQREELMKGCDSLRDRDFSRPLYIDDSGTSMAAPHVSGAIAAFLSIRREFIGRPDEVKRIFLENATSLGRERYFEGHGMVDLMRAIQAV
jgi:serine protease AprX